MITVPEAFARETARREGRAGRTWLAQLPDQVQMLLERWHLRVAGPATHGAVAVVVPVTRRGEPAALKLSFPHPGNASEAGALAAFAGRGAVRLIDHDVEHYALLLERAHREDLSTLADTDAAVAIAGQLSHRLAAPAPAWVPLLASTTARWAVELAEQHQRAEAHQRLPETVLAAARDTIAVIAADRTSTLVHGDLHFGNILRAEREPWLAIDPKGYAGTAAFEAGTVVRERPEQLIDTGDVPAAAAERVRDFSRTAQVDPDLSLRCAQARSVSSYYWELQHQQPAASVTFLHQLSLGLAP